MRRREFIAALGGAAAWPVAVHAQRTNPMPRVAVLGLAAEDDFVVQSMVNALKQGLAVLGWTPGANVRIDVRLGDEVSKVQKFAKEFVTTGEIFPDSVPWLFECGSADSLPWAATQFDRPLADHDILGGFAP